MGAESISPTQYDLWGSVVTCGDDDRVVFMVEGGAAKVNELYCGVVYSPFIALLRGRRTERTVYELSYSGNKPKSKHLSRNL